MKVLIKQFLGKNHSWSVCGWGIAQAIIKQGHQVDLFSTDGIKNLPKNLHNNIIGYQEENGQLVIGKLPDQDYDCQISYTAMKNFPFYLSNGNKNRFGIWCYEWANKNVLPTGFAKHHLSCDVLCPPSQFAKQVFLDSRVPESKIKVIPHGIIASDYSKEETIQLPTKKKFKILANIAQNHIRKNIDGLLEAYGKAFTDKDDVCLIIKGKDQASIQQYGTSIMGALNKFKQKFKNHAEVKMFSEFLNDISLLYRSVDATFSMTHTECFYMPGLESIASGKLAIAPNYGGQLDFLDKTNSLLVEGKEARANPKSMYWESKNNAIWFQPDISDAVEKLRFAYQNYENLNKTIKSNQATILKEYDWSNISQKYLNLCL
jgi:glycosyltransferase involved in cell wall biosynthesis